MPPSRCRRVDFPPPDGPTTARNSPGGDLEIDAVERDDRLRPFVDLAHGAAENGRGAPLRREGRLRAATMGEYRGPAPRLRASDST